MTDSKVDQYGIIVKDVVLKKKILRDLREFFRIYFSKRFVSKEFTTDEQKLEWVTILLNELGFKIADKSDSLLNLFPFFFQVHRPKHDHNKFKATVDFENSQLIEVFERYNTYTAKLFYQDDICKQLFRYVFIKFRSIYDLYVNSKIRCRIDRQLEDIFDFQD